MEISVRGFIGFVVGVCLLTAFPAECKTFLYYGMMTLAGLIGLTILYYATRALIVVGQVLFVMFVLFPVSLYRKITA